MNDYDGKLVIGTVLDTKKFDKQIEATQKRLDDLKADIDTSGLKEGSHELLQLELQAEKLENKLKRLEITDFKQSLNQVKNIEFNPQSINNIPKIKLQDYSISGDLKEINGELQWVASNVKDIHTKWEDVNKGIQKTNKSTKKYENSIEKVTKKMKKLGLSILSIGSVYGLVSRASSAYLSQNEEIANKLQSVWVGLGSFLSPVIDGISETLLRGLGYINEFVKALTGVDYVANANARAIKNQTDAQKKLNKETQNYDFDVIRTQQGTTINNGTSSSISGYIDIPELDNRIVSKLQDLAYWLEENMDLVKNLGIVLGVTFGAVKIGNIVGNIATLIGGATTGGVLGLTTALGVLAAALATLAGIEIAKTVKAYKELKEMQKNNIEMEDDLIERNKNVSKTFEDMVKSGQATEKQIDGVKWATEDATKMLLTQIEANKGNIKYQKKLAEKLQVVTDRYKFLYDQGLLNEEETKRYKEYLEKTIEQLKNMGIETGNLETQLKNLNENEFKIKIKTMVDTEEGKKQINKLFDYIENSSFFGKNPVFGNMITSYLQKGKKTLGFAQGGIVTQPTRALIGEAGYPEVILPMKQDYLSTLANEIARFSGTKSNQPINIYLDGKLIQRQVANVQNQVNFATNS